MNIRPAVQFAWRGSGGRWDATSFQLLGGIAGGIITLALGIRMPQAILDNVNLASAIASVLGSIFGVLLVFLVRLVYWPLQVRFERQGGPSATLKAWLGDVMWPILLTVLGIFLFFIFFGAGVILFFYQNRPGLAASNFQPISIKALSFEDRQYRIDARRFVLSDCQNLIGAFYATFSALNTQERTNQQSHIYLDAYNTWVNHSDLSKNWQDLIKYAQQNVDEIDPDMLSNKLVATLESYRSQTVIAVVAEEHSTDHSIFDAWRDTDRQTRHAFIKLRSATSDYLKEAFPPALFVTEN